MKTTLVILALLASTAVSAQEEVRPVGATGPGVQYTERVVGQVIAVGSPLYRHVPVGYVCPEGTPQPQKPHSSVNGGTLIGAIIGGVVGSQIGDGRGQTAATIGGTMAGAYIGDKANQRIHAQPNVQPSQCTTTFEQRIVGWTYTANYSGIQVQGVMSRQPQVGENVTIIVTSKFYAGE